MDNIAIKEFINNFINSCSCTSSCKIELENGVLLNFNVKDKKELLTCSELKLDTDIQDAKQTIKDTLSLFKMSEIISEDAPYRLMETSTMLSWEAIKKIKKIETSDDVITKVTQVLTAPILKMLISLSILDDNTTLSVNDIVKIIFWMFRKIIVDNLLIIATSTDVFYSTDYSLANITDIKAFSVGSTKISSDYDITLYGNQNDLQDIRKRFDSLFYEIFLTESPFVFDTNLYTISPLALRDDISDKTFTEICSVGTIFEFKSIDDLQSPEFHRKETFIALLKLIDVIRNYFTWNSLGDKLIELFSKKVKDSSYETSFKNANILLDTLLRVKTEDKQKFKDGLLGSKNIEVKDGVLNFFENESYYTTGAFVDVVVMQQMKCKDIDNIPKEVYVNSFIENCADLLTNVSKDKYIQRIRKSLEKIISKRQYQTELNSLHRATIKCSSNKIKKCDIVRVILKVIKLVNIVLHNNNLQDSEDELLDTSIFELNEITRVEDIVPVKANDTSAFNSVLRISKSTEGLPE